MHSEFLEFNVPSSVWDKLKTNKHYHTLKNLAKHEDESPDYKWKAGPQVWTQRSQKQGPPSQNSQ